MRLALLAPIGRSIPPRYDGPRERQIALLCAGLVRQGVNVAFVCQRGFHGSRTTGCRLPGGLYCRPAPRCTAWENLHIAHLSARAGEFDLSLTSSPPSRTVIPVAPIVASKRLTSPVAQGRGYSSPQRYRRGTYSHTPHRRTRLVGHDSLATWPHTGHSCEV